MCAAVYNKIIIDDSRLCCNSNVSDFQNFSSTINGLYPYELQESMYHPVKMQLRRGDSL